MSDSNQAGGDAQSGNSGGRKGKRPFRNRRRGRKPQSEQPEPRQEQEAGGARPKSRRSSNARSKGNGAPLDPVKHARRDRRRRKRSGDRAPTPPQPEPVMELDIEPKQVFVYTHVLRPSLRDAYEYRAEHFSHTGRTLADFRIDLSSIFIYPDGDLEAEPVIDLHIGGALVGLEDDESGEDGGDANDWDDGEPFGEDLL